MKRVLILTPLALAAMAGCSKGADQIQAGQWEMVTELRSVDMPGAPPELQQQIRTQIGRPDSGSNCLTAEQARNFLQYTRQLLTQGQAANCRFTDETYAGGVLRQRAACPGPGGQSGSSMSLDGGFTVTTFNGTVNAERPNPVNASSGPIRMTAVIRGRRLGECTATPPPAGLPAGL
jgi:hypothetical protein